MFSADLRASEGERDVSISRRSMLLIWISTFRLRQLIGIAVRGLNIRPQITEILGRCAMRWPSAWMTAVVKHGRTKWIICLSL